MKILITGGCGFVGSTLALSLRADGHEVMGFDNLSRRGSEVILDRIRSAGCAFMHGDIRNEEDLARLPGRYDLMLECSAEPSVMAAADGEGARYVVRNNLVGSANCLEFCRRASVPMMFMSTSRVYSYAAINALSFRETDTRVVCEARGPGLTDRGLAEDFPLDGPRSLYGATKLASELLAQEYAAQYGLPVLVNRCGVLAGPWQMGKSDQGVMAFWMASHLLGRPLRYIGFGGHGKQVRDVLHAADFADLVRRQIAVVGTWRGEIYNVGGGPEGSLSLRETTDLCARLSGRTVPVGCEPATRPADVVWYVTDHSRASRVFGWMPTRRPEQILADIRDWMISLGEVGLRRLFGA